MDIQTSPDPVARAHKLRTEIAAAADEIERARRIPEALLGRLHDSRLFRMLLPRLAGGDQTEPAVYVAAIEVLAQHDASVAWNVFVANSSALIAAYLDPAVNHAVFADPRSIVAWGPPNASRASAVDAGYRLTGKWDFASELGKMSPDCIDHRGLLADEQMAGAVENQAALLLGGFGWYKPHVGPGDCLANGLCISRIILLALDVGLHIGRWDQPHGVTQCLELARPVVRRPAGFDTDQTWRKLVEERQDVAALQLAANNHLAASVNAMNLEN